MSTDHSNRNENPKGGSEKKSSGKDDNRGNNSNNNSSGVGRVGIAGALAVLLSKTKWVFAAAKVRYNKHVLHIIYPEQHPHYQASNMN